MLRLILPWKNLFVLSLLVASLALRSQAGVAARDQIYFPDSEIVYSPTALDFNPTAYLDLAGGYLSVHREYLIRPGWSSAGEIVQRIALEYSINPRLLLALLEYECGCVRGASAGQLADGTVLGVADFHYKGLYGQLAWASRQLSRGYYGWREGQFALLETVFGNPLPARGVTGAGSAALLNYFVQLRQLQGAGTAADEIWQQDMDGQSGFPALYRQMFPDAWQAGVALGAPVPAEVSQPAMQLPFETDVVWSLASGPHAPWDREGALAALDFAPATYQGGCVASSAWVTAVADGSVARLGEGLLVQEISSTEKPDGREQTGWAVLYLHLDLVDTLKPGNWLQAGDRLGHPACVGGPATGTNLHLARKYNGEWVAAGGRLPFVLSGWVAQNGNVPYRGSLVQADQRVIASQNGAPHTWIKRTVPAQVTPAVTRQRAR